MRICSLVPSATEIVCALGLGESLVGVTHECAFPPEVANRPRVVESLIDPALSSAAIDAVVRARLARGESLYRLRLDALEQARPDLVITQELCEVCAIDVREVRAALQALPSRPAVVSLHPHTLDEIVQDVLTVGEAAQRRREAAALVGRLRARLDRVTRAGASAARRPRVASIEWLEPLMGCGHWVPEMVALAGGREMIGQAGVPSRVVDWRTLVEAQPEVVLVMPCGFSIQRTTQEMAALTRRPGWGALPAVRTGEVWLVDGPSYFNQSGPRVVDGAEIVAALLHPELEWPIPPGAAERWPA